MEYKVTENNVNSLLKFYNLKVDYVMRSNYWDWNRGCITYTRR